VLAGHGQRATQAPYRKPLWLCAPLVGPSLAWKRLAKRPGHCRTIGRAGHFRIVPQERLEGAHDLMPLEIGEDAIRPLSCGVPAPRKPAREGASDHLRNHPHTGVFILPAFDQTLCGYVRPIGRSQRSDQCSGKDASGDAAPFTHSVQLCSQKTPRTRLVRPPYGLGKSSPAEHQECWRSEATNWRERALCPPRRQAGR